jgi:hypothetical protein
MVKVVREVLEKDENVLLAYLFGSTAKGATQPSVTWISLFSLRRTAWKSRRTFSGG